MGVEPDLMDKHFVLVNDIDLDPNLPGGRVFDQAVIPEFSGTFDGNNHVISNLVIQGEGILGLFGALGSGAAVINLGMEQACIVGSIRSSVGALAGYNVGGSIANCYSTGTVSGDSRVGGLVGCNDLGSIFNCYSTVTVSGNADIGGLVGNNSGSIYNCYSIGMVSGHWSVGGLVGGNDGGDMINCYSTGIVTGTPESVGGLVGDNSNGQIAASFWDMETSGLATSDGGTGMKTIEMQDINTFRDSGWDFIDEMSNGTCGYWQISLGDYPRFNYPVMPEGLGTAEQPYLIRDARDLGTMWFKPIAHYRLEAPVDLSGTTWSIAVVPWFEGIFDGNGYVISNLYIQGSGYLGLFGQLGSESKISNLGLQAVDVSGTDDYIGSLVGYSSGSITTSYSTGIISGGSYVGGLIGRSLDAELSGFG
jgi:hypothetical protein